MAEIQMYGGPGGINPTPDQLEAVARTHPEGRVQMINLLKFRERARYPEDYRGSAATDVTGEEAYQRYGAVALAHVQQRGGHLVLLSVVDGVVLGPMTQDEWDQVAIVEYPSVEAFVDMGEDPDYQAATVHRTAGLARSVILASTPVIEAPPRP